MVKRSPHLAIAPSCFPGSKPVCYECHVLECGFAKVYTIHVSCTVAQGNMLLRLTYRIGKLTGGSFTQCNMWSSFLESSPKILCLSTPFSCPSRLDCDLCFNQIPARGPYSFKSTSVVVESTNP